MRDGSDFNDLFGVIHGVNHSVVTNPNSPCSVFAAEFYATDRPRSRSQCPDSFNDAIAEVNRKTGDFFFCRAPDKQPVRHPYRLACKS